MDQAAFDRIKKSMLREVDRTVRQFYHQSLAEILNEMYVRSFITRPDPMTDDVFVVIEHSRLLRDILDPRGREVNEAVSRLAKGTFGMCAKCGQEMRSTVLEMDPTRRLCERCTSARNIMNHLPLPGKFLNLLPS